MRRKQRESQTSETYRCNVYVKQGRYRNSGIRDNGISKDRQESQGRPISRAMDPDFAVFCFASRYLYCTLSAGQGIIRICQF